MELKLRDILLAEQPLMRLSEIKMSALCAFRLGLVIRQIRPVLDTFYEHRNRLAREFGEEKDGQITIPPDRVGEFMEKLKPLLEESVDVNFTPFNPQDIQGETTPADMYALYWLFDRDGTEHT
jgi:FAD/FMN-containing dehydrogenase